jgi:SET domain-containing protein
MKFLLFCFVLTIPCLVNYSNIQTIKKISIGISTIPNAGFGMFAREDIRMGTIIETCPLLFIKLNQMTQENILWKYVFKPTFKNDSFTTLALGYCSIYNHSPNPNLHYIQDCGRVMRIIAINPIKNGDEMFINYGENYSWETPLMLEYK